MQIFTKALAFILCMQAAVLCAGDPNQQLMAGVANRHQGARNGGNVLIEPALGNGNHQLNGLMQNAQQPVFNGQQRQPSTVGSFATGVLQGAGISLGVGLAAQVVVTGFQVATPLMGTMHPMAAPFAFCTPKMLALASILYGSYKTYGALRSNDADRQARIAKWFGFMIANGAVLVLSPI